ncbi:hypothetical protein VR610_08535 [Aquirufa regiilacus]
MLKGIVVYFLFLFCLLTKDGISLALDVIREKGNIACEMNLEDSFEEDSLDDFFASEEFGLALNQNQKNGFTDKSITDQYQRSTLNVLLEQVSPPPRIA